MSDLCGLLLLFVGFLARSCADELTSKYEVVSLATKEGENQSC